MVLPRAFDAPGQRRGVAVPGRLVAGSLGGRGFVHLNRVKGGVCRAARHSLISVALQADEGFVPGRLRCWRAAHRLATVAPRPGPPYVRPVPEGPLEMTNTARRCRLLVA